MEKTYQRAELKWRRNHIAEVVGSHMFIYGGIDEDFRYLSDMWVLDLYNFIWMKVTPKTGKIVTPTLAFHCSTMAYGIERREHPNFKFSSFSEIPNSRQYRKLKGEGLYIFGGMDEEKNMKNDIRYLKLGKKQIEWVAPKTEGNGPCARISATMNYLEDLHVLVITGGCDKDRKLFYNDIYILDLEKYKWTKINVYNDLPIRRAEHCSILLDKKLIVFGGINSKCYVGSELYVVNFGKIEYFMLIYFFYLLF